ncbi:MAG: hypothetical protein JO364_15505 [Pseudonocardiales bacterium]|nr:hypothetical protein [Pseudonocardiales bacterium]MBV9031678.1 hypothetical protein [Pseudonocardiales bacterium]
MDRLYQGPGRTGECANAAILAGLPGITLDPDTVETNIVVFGLADAPRLSQRLEAEHGVRMGALGPDLVQAVTRHDVDTAATRRARSPRCSATRGERKRAEGTVWQRREVRPSRLRVRRVPHSCAVCHHPMTALLSSRRSEAGCPIFCQSRAMPAAL